MKIFLKGNTGARSLSGDPQHTKTVGNKNQLASISKKKGLLKTEGIVKLCQSVKNHLFLFPTG